MLTLSVDLNMEPAEHVVFEGSMTGRPLGQVQSKESAEIVVPVCFVSSGRFDCTADIRTWEHGGRDGWAGSGQISVLVDDS